MNEQNVEEADEDYSPLAWPSLPHSPAFFGAFLHFLHIRKTLWVWSEMWQVSELVGSHVCVSFIFFTSQWTGTSESCSPYE